MKKKMLSWGIVSLSLILICIAVLSISGSLWFLRALLSEGAGEFTIGFYNQLLESTSVGKDMVHMKESFLPDVTSGYSRFVYKKDSNGEYIVGVPYITKQFSLVSDLQQRGWQTDRIGWLIIGSHTTTSSVPSYSLRHATGSALRHIIWERLPLHPLLVLQVEGREADSFALYLEENNGGVHVAMNTQSPHFFRGKSQRMKKDTLDSKMTYVSLQRDVLSHLPNEFGATLERKISDSMHFIKTHPRMLESLLPLGSLAIVIEGDGTAIGVLSQNTGATTLMSEWINTEQGIRHPKKRAFSLPDKTLGYEYIPGVSSAYFNLNKGNNSCFPSENYDEQLFLCGKDRAVVLSNQGNIGTQLASSLQDPFLLQRGIIQGDVMSAIGLGEQFEKIEYIFSDEMVEAWADTKVK